MFFKHFAISAALCGSVALAAFPGGPYTIWSDLNPIIHLDNVGAPGNPGPINGEAYVKGSANQYWSPELASPDTQDVYYIRSAVTGRIYANGTSGAGLNARPYASPFLFTLVPGSTNNFTITVPETNLAITMVNITGLQITLQPLITGDKHQHWSLTDHGVPSGVNATT